MDLGESASLEIARVTNGVPSATVLPVTGTSYQEANATMGAIAAKRAVAVAGLEADDIDLIVLATLTPDHITPATAVLVKEALEECKRLAAVADTLVQKISGNDEFSNKAAKMEMLQRLERRRQQLAEGIKGYGGNNKPQDDPKVLDAQRERLTKQCTSFYAEQAKVQGELHDLLDGDKRFLTRDLGEAKEHIRQLEDLQQRWWVDFRELKTTMAKLGVPNFDLPMFKPDEAILAFYEKAAGVG